MTCDSTLKIHTDIIVYMQNNLGAKLFTAAFFKIGNNPNAYQ